MKVEFEELKYPMYHMATKFCRRFPEFQVDELINEFWLSYHVQHMKDARMIWKACEWAFWFYYRRQKGLSTQTGKPLVRRKGTTISLEEVGIEEINNEPAVIEIGYEDIDTKDFRKELFKKLTPKEKFICICRYRGKTQKQVGDFLDLSSERVRQIERQIFTRKVRPMLCA